FPHELSGGMRQRVMIAMMLSRNPELLIADEPTTALDVTIEAQILEIIKDLKKTYDTAIMLITHNFGLVAEVADKIAVMYAGEVIEYGDVYEIFEKPLHPYTTLLMKALPRKTKHEGRLQTIDGNVPRIMDKKPGCRFANRCPYAMDQCKDNTPPEVFVSEEHKCRCFLMEEGKEAEA
ncbi:MAG: ABC transporter ATP-binding protein, partial [Firmicutes bacterium]|nr:ABC transporter ATP-binding protein [Bacillota bacterium]